MDEKGLWGWIQEHWKAAAGGSALILLYIARVKAVASVLKQASDWVVTAFNGLAEMKKMTAAQNVQLASIIAELRPNGGGSLRDKVEATHRLVLIAAARSRFLIAESDHATYECDLSGRCIYASPTLCTMFGMNEQDMLGNGWQQAIREDELEDVRAAWQRAIDQDYPYEQNYTVIHRRHGKEYKLHTSMKPVRDNYGKPIAYHGVVHYRRNPDTPPI